MLAACRFFSSSRCCFFFVSFWFRWNMEIHRMIYRNHANLRHTIDQRTESYIVCVCARTRERTMRKRERVSISTIITLPLVSIFRKWFEIMSNSVSLLIIWLKICWNWIRKKQIDCRTLEIMRPHFTHTNSAIPLPHRQKRKKNQQPKKKRRNKRDKMNEKKKQCRRWQTQSKAEIKKCFECSYPCGRS